MQPARVKSENALNRAMVLDTGHHVRLVVIHVSGSDDENRLFVCRDHIG